MSPLAPIIIYRALAWLSRCCHSIILRNYRTLADHPLTPGFYLSMDSINSEPIKTALASKTSKIIWNEH